MVRKEILFFREPYRKATNCHPKTLNFPTGIHLKTPHKIKLSDHTVAVWICSDFKRLPNTQSNWNQGQTFWKTVLYALIIFRFTGHLLVLTRTSSRAKLFLYQAHLNPGKSRVHVQSPRGLKNRNSNHFSKIVVFFTPQSVGCAKKYQKNLTYVFPTLAALLRWKFSHIIQRKSIDCKKAI